MAFLFRVFQLKFFISFLSPHTYYSIGVREKRAVDSAAGIA
jgi:hypothetical protein